MSRGSKSVKESIARVKALQDAVKKVKEELDKVKEANLKDKTDSK